MLIRNPKIVWANSDSDDQRLLLHVNIASSSFQISIDIGHRLRSGLLQPCQCAPVQPWERRSGLQERSWTAASACVYSLLSTPLIEVVLWSWMITWRLGWGNISMRNGMISPPAFCLHWLNWPVNDEISLYGMVMWKRIRNNTPRRVVRHSLAQYMSPRL